MADQLKLSLLMKYLLPLPIVENDYIRNQESLRRIICQQEGEFFLQCERPVGSSVDGLGVPPHVYMPPRGEPEGIISDIDTMIVHRNLYLSKDETEMCQIFTVEPTTNPIYVHLRETEDYARLSKMDGQESSGTSYIETVSMTKPVQKHQYSHRQNVQERLKNRMTFVETEVLQGPSAAVYFQTPNSDLNVDFDCVPAYFHEEWPAREWEIRTRPFGWPSEKLITTCVSKGCFLVPTGPGGRQGLEWRYSFTAQERLLAQSMSAVQRKTYIMFKLIYRYFIRREFPTSAVSSYHLKNLLFWRSEKLPPKQWTQNNMPSNVVMLLNDLLQCAVSCYLPHYFLPNGNLFERVPRKTLRQFAKSVVTALKNLGFVLEILYRHLDFKDLNEFISPFEATENLLTISPEPTLHEVRYHWLNVFASEYILLIAINLSRLKICETARMLFGHPATSGRQFEISYRTAINYLTDCLLMVFNDIARSVDSSDAMVGYLAERRVHTGAAAWIISYHCYRRDLSIAPLSLFDLFFNALGEAIGFSNDARTQEWKQRVDAWLANPSLLPEMCSLKSLYYEEFKTADFSFSRLFDVLEEYEYDQEKRREVPADIKAAKAETNLRQKRQDDDDDDDVDINDLLQNWSIFDDDDDDDDDDDILDTVSRSRRSLGDEDGDDDSEDTDTFRERLMRSILYDDDDDEDDDDDDVDDDI